MNHDRTKIPADRIALAAALERTAQHATSAVESFSEIHALADKFRHEDTLTMLYAAVRNVENARLMLALVYERETKGDAK
jgi:hypothetical protein